MGIQTNYHLLTTWLVNIFLYGGGGVYFLFVGHRGHLENRLLH